MSPCNKDDLARAFYPYEGERAGPVSLSLFFADSVAPPPSTEKKLAPVCVDAASLAVVARLVFTLG
jgi:hypothetical protein